VTNRETVENNGNGQVDFESLTAFARQKAKLEKDHPGASEILDNALKHTWRMEWAWFCFGVVSLVIALASVAICALVSVEFVKAGATTQGALSMVTGSATVAAVFMGKRMATTPIRRKRRAAGKTADQPVE
jgi:hypothetical protein